MIRRETLILMLLLLATPAAAGRKVVIPGVALTIEEPWKACWIAPGELTKIVPAMSKAGAAGIAIFNYQSLFSPRCSQFGYTDEVRQLFRKP